ncbi:phage tail-collar fiber domain-containing protein [Providencia hangzhouensis]|uniref:phage tail-collar fiber domain-containing protein n=1 Tax=Providencia hangzhouensis TaxID=3031799 RepID=UPI0034DCF91E
MPSIITDAFQSWNADKIIANQPAVADQMVFALIKNQDPNAEISPSEGMPNASDIVYSTDITRIAKLDDNTVVYSVVLDTTVGDWEYNWIGLVDSATSTVLMIVHTDTQKKIKTVNGQQGNSLIRNLTMTFSGAAAATQITVTPETWQIDLADKINTLEINIDEKLSHKVDKADVTQEYGTSKEKVPSQALLTKSLAEMDLNLSTKVSKSGDNMTGSLSITGKVTPSNYENFDNRYAQRDKNLSDLKDKTAARTNLDVYSKAEAVPATRTVNKKALSANIDLTPEDVGAVPKTRTVNKKALNSDITLTPDDISAVPTTRKINGMPLSSDVTITAGQLLAITGIRAGAASRYDERSLTEYPPGFMTTWADFGGSSYVIKVRPIQYLIGDNWYTASFL